MWQAYHISGMGFLGCFLINCPLLEYTCVQEFLEVHPSFASQQCCVYMYLIGNLCGLCYAILYNNMALVWLTLSPIPITDVLKGYNFPVHTRLLWAILLAVTAYTLYMCACMHRKRHMCPLHSSAVESLQALETTE